MVVPLDDGIVRITFPLPLGHRPRPCVPRCRPTTAGRSLVDTGLGLPGADERWAADSRAGRSARPHRRHPLPSRPRRCGRDRRRARRRARVPGRARLRDLPCGRGRPRPRSGRSSTCIEHGMPQDEAAAVRAQQEQLTAFVHFARDPEPLEPGQTIGGWEVLHLPGHADGHLALLRDGVLVAGDALLGGITPNVGLWPGSAPDPLADYLGSLERIAELDATARAARPRRADSRSCRPRTRDRRAPRRPAAANARRARERAGSPATTSHGRSSPTRSRLAPPLRSWRRRSRTSSTSCLAGRATRATDDGRTTYATV